MAPLSLRCNQCGASLDVPDSTNFVTCGKCGANLAVKRLANAAFTEVAGEPAAPLVGRIDELEYQNEINHIDRRWQQEREQYLLYGMYHRPFVPTKDFAFFVCVLTVLLAVVVAAANNNQQANWSGDGAYAAAGVLLFLGLGASAFFYYKAARYEEAEQYVHHEKRKARDKHLASGDPG